MKGQLVKWGNSLAVRIPKPVAEEARLKEGETLEIRATSDGSLELRKSRKVPSLSELVSRITPENRYEEVSTRVEVGKERLDW